MCVSAASGLQQHYTMKNPELEAILQGIEDQDGKRRRKVASILRMKGKDTKPKSNQAGSAKIKVRPRRKVIEGMIARAKSRTRRDQAEARRSMFGQDTRRGMLLHPEPKPELGYDRS